MAISYGTIRYLGKGRRNPYAVHPPVKEFDEDGKAKLPPALCYVDDWLKGFSVLTAYKAGTYEAGMENDIKVDDTPNSDFLKRIFADYARMTRRTTATGKTFAEVYEEFFTYKYERDKSRKYSKQAKASTRAAFKNCAALHERIFADLKHNDLQGVVDDCKLKHSSLELIVSLFHQLYAYAMDNDICDRDYSANVKINIPDDDENGVAFTIDEIKKIWEHRSDPTAEMLIIMCYSGFRIEEYKKIVIDLKNETFLSGSKTEAGKDRYVPIHECILPLVKERMKRYGCLLPFSAQKFRDGMYAFLKSINIEKHTPHDCRHTFSMLCEKYHVSERDQKRMMGHKIADITSGTYGHRSLADLRIELKKIPAVDNLKNEDKM